MTGSGKSSSKPQSAPPGIGRRLGDLLAILVITVLTALLVKTFILDASHISSRSMMDALQPGDYVLVNKFLYGARTPPSLSGDYGPLPSVQLPALRDPRRGDILLFWFPSGTGFESFRSARQFVKRCVAVPGDTLIIDRGSVQVNGRTAVVLDGDTVTHLSFTLPRPGEVVTVDARSPAILRELVQRDRDLSDEEPRGGERGGENVQEDAISTPTNPAADTGTMTASTSHIVVNEFYFLLGDRTSLSVDSRHWGLIPRAWVIGTPIAVYWSVEPGSADGGLSSRLHGIRWLRLGHLVR